MLPPRFALQYGCLVRKQKIHPKTPLLPKRFLWGGMDWDVCGFWLVSCFFFFLGGGEEWELQHDEVEMMTGLRSIYEALLGFHFTLLRDAHEKNTWNLP